MHPMLNIAIQAARQAGNIIARSAHRVDTLKITTKAHNDFVSEVDQAAEREIIDTIHRAYPNHAILAEESGASGDSEYEWIIDPLDGTTNFLHGFPQYAVSIALRHKDRLEQAVIYDPCSQDLFTASRGEGAQLNGRRMRVTERKSIEGALIGTGIPFRDQNLIEPYLAILRTLQNDVSGIRRAGSAALDLAYVAAGRLDGFWEFDLKPWDCAAGILLIIEAGGLVSDFGGGHDYFVSGNVAAGNPKILKALLQAIHPHLPPHPSP